MKKQLLVVMFAFFLVLFSASACENKSADVKPDAEPTTEEKVEGKEAPKADAGKEAPKEEAKEAEAVEGKEAPKKEEPK